MADSRIISGIVDPSGNIFSGTGFKVDKTATGIYTVLFLQEFNVLPAVVATQIYPWPMTNDSHGGDTRDNAVVVYISSDRARIKTGNSGGVADNRAFAFVATGL